jgi:hypothetical protein
MSEDRDAKMPDEPRSLRKARFYDSGGYVMGDVRVSDIIGHIDDLLDYAKSEHQKRLEAEARVKELESPPLVGQGRVEVRKTAKKGDE